ncbi:MAG: aryl-sulfate sulfotransferase [Saprospiraceae bacterium]|nr:aryl-sulfate sulfotransferase [Saprospiraceae bacterium]
MNRLLPLALLILFALNCKKDDQLQPVCNTPDPDPDPDPIEQGPFTVLDCTDSTVPIDFLAGLDEAGILLRSVTQDTALYIFTYENDSIYGMDLNCLTSLGPRPADWKYDLTYSDGSTQSIGYIGTINLEAALNPSGYAPLTANLTVSAAEKGKVSIRVVGKNGEYSDVNKTFDDYSDVQTLPILGLYSDWDNLIEVQYLSPTGQLRVQDSIYISTGALIPNLPSILVTKSIPDRMAAGMTLVSYQFLTTPKVPFMIDSYGDVRWYLDYENHPVLNKMDYINSIERLQNGNLYFGNADDEIIYEVDMLGEILNTWPLPSGYAFHHDIHEKADGNFLITLSNLSSTHLNGNGAKEDHIMEIDRQTGAVVMEWDLKEPLDEYRVAFEDNLDNNPIDWLHVNSVMDDPSDNTIIISGRQQGVFKIDYSNQLIWGISPIAGWGQNRYGQNVEDFMLKAVDANGQILDEIYQNGSVNHPDFEWPWLQHAPLIMPNGNIMLFDNGPFRNFEIGLKYSRAVEYQIDVADMTIKQVWQYGKERGLETWSRAASDVDFLPETNTVLFLPGYDVPNSYGQKGGKIIELDYGTNEVIYEVELNNPDITYFQSERLTLYAE